MNVLILGSKGQLGSQLCKYFLKLKSINFIGISRDEFDLTNLENLNIYFQNKYFNFVINCIAYTDVNLAETKKKESNFINNIYVKYLSNLSVMYDFKIIHFSTDYVFDGKLKKPYNENHLPNPINHYGYSKYLGDKNLINSNAKFLILRTSGVYDNYSDNFVTKILKNLKLNRDIKVTYDQVCNPTPVYFLSKIVHFFLENFEKYQNSLFNAVPSKPLSWFDFAKIIKLKYEISHNSKSTILPVLYKDLNNKCERPLNTSLDNSKLNKILDFNIKNCDELFLEMSINE
jgi:dTDP-4-dehydrorhamnose reductase